MKNWASIIILIVISILCLKQYRDYSLHQADLKYWLVCHPFIDLIPSNQNGLRPDPGGTITIVFAPPGETIYTQGSQWPSDHCFDSTVCGNFGILHTGESETCENCPSSGTHTITVPCEDGGGEDCCDKFLVEISAPFELECGECATICATTNNYINPEYEWSTGETTECIEVCMAGTYTVTVMEQITDDCMCMHASAEQIFIADDELTCEVDNLLLCGNLPIPDEFDLIVTGTNPPFSFSWTGPNGFTSSLEDPFVVDEGLYNVEITDSNGCVVMCSANVFYKGIVDELICL